MYKFFELEIIKINQKDKDLHQIIKKLKFETIAFLSQFVFRLEIRIN